MKSARYLTAFLAVIIMFTMTACSDKEPEVIDVPQVLIPHTSSTTQQTTTTAEEQTTTASEPQTTTTATEPVEVTAPETSEPVEITEEAETEEPLDPMDYGAYLLDSEEMEFTERSIFVGDSICKGFGTYNVLSFSHVYANGSMGTRNFNEYTFTYGKKNEQIDFTELLHRTQPELVFLSMGMNDINMIQPSKYRSNYAKIVDTALRESDAVVYLCGMTPVRSNFTSNERIEYFNAELQQLAAEYPERVCYVYYGHHMMNDEGVLNNQLDGGDGVHLAPYAYRIALWEIYHTLLEDGTLYPKAMNADETTEATAEISEEAESAEAVTVDATSETIVEVVTEEAYEETSAPELSGGIRVE
ncbi:MAG: SGNH/GDSL hydrolase family protein [Oscillospiraceae bacterium]|nr:SGNH/GDSL hydrolase family protein [Oscillospiraceae bacterium]